MLPWEPAVPRGPPAGGALLDDHRWDRLPPV